MEKIIIVKKFKVTEDLEDKINQVILDYASYWVRGIYTMGNEFYLFIQKRVKDIKPKKVKIFLEDEADEEENNDENEDNN